MRVGQSVRSSDLEAGEEVLLLTLRGHSRDILSPEMKHAWRWAVMVIVVTVLLLGAFLERHYAHQAYTGTGTGPGSLEESLPGVILVASLVASLQIWRRGCQLLEFT